MKRLLFPLVAAMTIEAHGYHCSLATVDYLSKSHALQAIFVVNSGDLENVLRKQTDRRIELDRTADASALVSAYLQRTVKVRDQGKEIPLKWVGMEVKTNLAYLYVEASASGPDALEIRDELLMDFLPDQVNMLTLRRDSKGKPFDCLFQQGSGFQAVKLN